MRASTAKRLLLCASVCTLLHADLLCAQSTETDERPRLQTEQKLLRSAQQIESQHGDVTTELIRPLRELGLLYVDWNRCADAVPLLDQAARLLRADEGLFTVTQLELFDPLERCYLALDRQSDFRRVQEYRVLIAERTHGRNNPATLSMLSRTARWYEEAGYYISAREIQAKALDIIRTSGGDNDVRIVEPLRGIARAYRLEYIYGIEPLDAEFNRGSRFESFTSSTSTVRTPDRLGELSLKSAVKSLEAHSTPDASTTTSAILIDTLLELAGWYQMTDDPRAAMAVYRRAWAVSQIHLDGHETLFDQPQPIPLQLSISLPWRRPIENEWYWADVDYTVTRGGRISDVKVEQSNAPTFIRWKLVKSLSNTLLRPRFVDGEPVDTEHVRSREIIWVGSQDASAFRHRQ
jgi:hypothetical protein